MAKLANYAIIAVRYNAANTHIDSVKRCELDANNNLGTAEERTRSTVVDAIENKDLSYMTFTKKDGVYKPGAKVEIIPVNGKKYLRTDSNKIEKDNLGSLPTF